MDDTTPKLPEKMRTYLDSARVPIAVSTVEDDAPLVYVNDRFCDLTGYAREECVGVNCRFLQGEATTDESRQEMHDFVHDPARETGRFHIANYKKDGSLFQNFVYMTRLRDGDGEARFILASQFDMTTTLQRSQIRTNDEKLGQALADMEQMGKEFGLAMMGSAKMISDSVALMARLTLTEERS